MESLEARPGQEDAWTPSRSGDQSSIKMMDRKLVEGYRLVDVYLTGGAPWGFTLKGGREHGEHLIITKVEEGSKAAEILMAGDEIVNINDIPLSGFRQEAICLVKGSHKTLKMIVKRKNDIAYRPHSWHSIKLIENPMETLNSNSNLNPSWNSRYHSSSSSYDISNSWDQTNLQRSSGHFSSVGSMDSIDQPYQTGRLSSAKSNNSIDYLGNQNKRDSAYGSFSTSFISPELSLSKTTSVSSENILYQINEWDNLRPVHGKTGQYLQEPKRTDDKQGYQSSSIFQEDSKPQRKDDNVELRNSGRSHFGPVWHVPDKKKTTSSPPPPPPPLRSDSYAVTKSHEKPAPTHFESSNTQHFNVANRSHLRTDWDAEIQDYQQRPYRAPERKLGDTRRINNNSYQSEINLDQIGYAKYPNNAPFSSKLQASQSSYDIRFAQPSYSNHHQRQYSDESTFLQNTRISTSIKAQPQQVAFSSGNHDVGADTIRVYNIHHLPSTESNTEGRLRGDSNAQYCITNTSSKVLSLEVGLPNRYRDDYGKIEVFSETKSMQQDSSAQKSIFGLPQQNNQPSPENCDVSKKETYLSSNERIKPRKIIDYHEEQFCGSNVQLHDLTNKTVSTSKYRSPQYCWNEEDSKITPQITPMLHSLTQEGRHLSVGSPDTSDKKNVLDPAKQARRSDRFATTLRNEIQQRKARLQKSKSTATLTESNEEEHSENWNQDSLESVNASSDGSFSNTYKNHLKEAQARVLRATSFKRRDLEPVIADPSLSPERKNQAYSISKSPLSNDPPTDHFPPRQITAISSSQNMIRIGGRKRFTAQQKLKSYSEPEKINEIGICEDNGNPMSSKASQEAVGSFADRWKFFEETSKPVQSRLAPKLTSAFTEENVATQNVKNNENVPKQTWHDKRSRAASLGADLLTDRDQKTNDCYKSTSCRTSDCATAQQPQRLETFAEYQASWREQKKPLERKNSVRCHSADNILDTGLDQNEKSTYIHERSRSSPTTDFYAKGGIVSSKKRATDGEGENAESARLTHCSSNSSLGTSARTVETGYVENPSVEKEDILHDSKCKPTKNSFEIPDPVNVPQQSRSRSGTLPSDYRFVNENVRYRSGDIGFAAVIPISETPSDFRHLPQTKEEIQEQDLVPVQRKKGPAPQRPPPPKLDKYWKQNGSTSSLSTSSESLPTPAQAQTVPYSSSLDVIKPDTTPTVSLGLPSDKHSRVYLHKPQLSGSPENDHQQLKKNAGLETEGSSKPCYLQKPGMEPSRSPSPQFAPQKLTDKPPLLVQDGNLTRIERVIENTKVKMVPIKIVHSESDAEKESRNNLLSANEPPTLHTGVSKDQLKTLSTSEQSYSLFCAYTRHESDEEKQSKDTDSPLVEDPSENSNESAVSSLSANNSKSKDLIYADLKSEELVREIVDKDKSLADILDPGARMMTTMDLMEGIFRKDEHLLEEAQQRRKMHPKVPSPKPLEEKKEDQSVAATISLTTSSTYYSTSAPKAELLIKMKDMKEQQPIEESSEEELDHNLCEKKQELIDSIGKKLQVLREARETLLEDIQCNNALGEEVEVIVKEVCKPNEFDKFRMFVGDLEKIVNLLLSLSGRLARVENALNNLDETASPEERRTLIEKRKLLTRQHEDAKELKENLDRRERTVFEILASYLNEENLADYEHFVKMKSALILEQRELEDKIKLGEEQLKCLTDSLTAERIK